MATQPSSLVNDVSNLAISQNSSMALSLEPQEDKLSWSIFQTLSWDPIQQIFEAIGPDEVAIFARTCRLHYSLAHGYLWHTPVLTLTQAQKFVGYLYRRPIVTASLPPHLAGALEQAERPETVKRVDLQYYLEEEYMDEIMLDTVTRLVKFCPGALIRIGMLVDRKQAWTKMTAGMSERVYIVGYEEVSPGEYVTEHEAERKRQRKVKLPVTSAMIVIAHVTGVVM